MDTVIREFVLDTETTGLDPKTGVRVVEIGCVELINHIQTGVTWHKYINPERDMPEGAFNVHGLSEDYLKDFPVFDKIAAEFMDFIQDSTLVIHNAEFDMKFLNAEMGLSGLPIIPMSQSLDTIAMARKKFPGAPASLDALCKRFQIDNSNRTLHGALLDAQLLADVYLELIGGRQRGMELAPEAKTITGQITGDPTGGMGPGQYPHRVFTVPDEEAAAHTAFLEKIKDPVWNA